MAPEKSLEFPRIFRLVALTEERVHPNSVDSNLRGGGNNPTVINVRSILENSFYITYDVTVCVEYDLEIQTKAQKICLLKKLIFLKKLFFTRIIILFPKTWPKNIVFFFKHNLSSYTDLTKSVYNLKICVINKGVSYPEINPEDLLTAILQQNSTIWEIWGMRRHYIFFSWKWYLSVKYIQQVVCKICLVIDKKIFWEYAKTIYAIKNTFRSKNVQNPPFLTSISIMVRTFHQYLIP